MIDEIDQMVDSAVSDVFSTMLRMPVSRVPDEPHLNGAEYVAASVGFNGDMNGVVYSYCTNSFARNVTCNLLGLEDSEIEDDAMVNDAMGEIANMIVGQIKSALCDRGLPCVLTIPSIVRGQNFSVQASRTTTRKASLFKSNDNQLVVEVLLKPEDS